VIEAPGADPGASFSSWGRGIPRRRPAEGRSRFHRRSAAYGRGRPFGPESPKGFGSYRDSGATPRSPNHRVGAGSTGDPRRRRGRPVRAGVAEGIRLLPRFRGHAAISQPQGRSRLHRRSAPAARPAPSGRGRRRDSAPTHWGATPRSPNHRVGAGSTGDPRPVAAAGPSGRGRRRDSAPTAIPGSRRDLPTTRVGAGCTGDPRAPRAGRPFGPGSPKGFGSYRDSGATPRFPNHRVGAGSTRDPRPAARPALRAGVAEGIRLLPRFRGHAAISQQQG